MAYRIEDACRLLGIGKTKLYDLAAGNHIRMLKIGRRTVVDAASLSAFIARAAGDE
jgi:excisionase family DNA binding protein